MKKISSDDLLKMARRLPIIYFAVITVFLILMVIGNATKIFIVPLVLTAFGSLLMKHLVGKVMDEVWDGGDYLLVKLHGQEERVALSNIMRISTVTEQNPPVITLCLHHAGKFGNKIAFYPIKDSINEWKFITSRKNEIAEDLICRVDKTRNE